ncbi:hypothetical protein CNR22_20345 [Sphingobacteriaceae bacterium]|nr:hypothetical protein CNR22_20345 [Sphingobacteriaceae bacterium]
MAKVPKYKEQISTVEDAKKTPCVGKDYSEMDCDTYRWTFEDINDERNFRPRVMDPSNPSREKIGKECGGWSLSLFTAEDFAVKELDRICHDKPNLYKKLGTHVAQGKIEKKHGICGDFNDNGHFEHLKN